MSANDIIVNGAINSSSASAQLQLNAGNDIVLNQPWSLTGAGSSLRFTASRGDIVVNAALTWGNAATLDLTAGENISINADMTGGADNSQLYLRTGRSTLDGDGFN